MHRLLRLMIGLALISGFPAVAHHSPAMYDASASRALSGVVKEFRWTNPHCWIYLQVEEGGATAEWRLEMGNPQQLYRLGWRPGTLKPGQAVRVTIRPPHDGGAHGLLISATHLDGTELVRSAP